jgi:hypothetical protein
LGIVTAQEEVDKDVPQNLVFSASLSTWLREGMKESLEEGVGQDP